jgi:hypothetical protein
MPIAKITGQGLSAIALSVALLWACLIGERGLVRQADVKRSQALEEIRRLRRQVEPPQRVSTPRPFETRPPKPALG